MKVNLNRAVHKLWENSPDKGAQGHPVYEVNAIGPRASPEMDFFDQSSEYY